MKKRLAYILSTYFMVLLAFVLAKVVFMLCYKSDYAFSISDMGDVLAHGLSLDLSTSLYFMAVPFLAMIAAVWIRLPRRLLWPYYALAAIILSLAFVADTSLYEFWHFKLDASCLSYLETPTEAMASVSTGYLILRLVVVLLLSAIIFWLYIKLEKYSLSSLHSPLSSLHSPLSTLLSETLFYLACIPLIVIGIRGGLGESTTNIGQVYFSSNQFLNHSAVNPVFSFLSSIGKSGKSIDHYEFFNDEELQQLTAGIYSKNADSIGDTLLSVTRPNIVIVAMESCGGQFTSLGGQQDIMPRLNALCQQGVFFSQCYANSWRTDKGLVSILSGYPAFPITSVMKIPEKSHKLPSIASTLHAEGYDNSFIYGGDINFTNMRSYVLGTGYTRLTWQTDFTQEEQHTAKWGVRDDITFHTLLQEIKNETAPHWMKTLMTLSSHEPWDVPTSRLEDPVYNAFNYLDKCLGEFIDSLRQTPQWHNTLVIILPDHGYRYRGVDETTRLYNHIPMLWVGGAVRQPCQIDRICNQSDLAATLFAQMHIAHDQFTFSRNVTSAGYNRQVAWHTYNNGVSLFDSTGFVAYDLDVRQIIASEGPDTEGKLQLARALLQLSSQDLINR